MVCSVPLPSRSAVQTKSLPDFEQEGFGPACKSSADAQHSDNAQAVIMPQDACRAIAVRSYLTMRPRRPPDGVAFSRRSSAFRRQFSHSAAVAHCTFTGGQVMFVQIFFLTAPGFSMVR